MNDINPILVERYLDACRHYWQRYYSISNTPDLLYQDNIHSLYRQLRKMKMPIGDLRTIFEDTRKEIQAIMD